MALSNLGLEGSFKSRLESVKLITSLTLDKRNLVVGGTMGYIKFLWRISKMSGSCYGVSMCKNSPADNSSELIPNVLTTSMNENEVGNRY
ncbi:hypothetical protein CR513_49997, partial [Mucuna pruriens]